MKLLGCGVTGLSELELIAIVVIIFILCFATLLIKVLTMETK